MRKYNWVIISIIAVIVIMIIGVMEVNQTDFVELEEDPVFSEPANKEVPSHIKFDTESGESIPVPISMIPDLETYLDGETDRWTEIERLQVEYLDWHSTNDQYFILKYSCGNKICQLILVQISELNEVKTVYLGDGFFTGFEGIENTVMLRIGINEGNEVIRHQIVIVDLNTMHVQHPLNKNDDELYFNSPLYPITQFKWMTTDTIELHVADVPDTTYESIQTWNKSDKLPVKSIKITIK